MGFANMLTELKCLIISLCIMYYVWKSIFVKRSISVETYLCWLYLYLLEPNHAESHHNYGYKNRKMSISDSYLTCLAHLHFFPLRRGAKCRGAVDILWVVVCFGGAWLETSTLILKSSCCKIWSFVLFWDDYIKFQWCRITTWWQVLFYIFTTWWQVLFYIFTRCYIILVILGLIKLYQTILLLLEFKRFKTLGHFRVFLICDF